MYWYFKMFGIVCSGFFWGDNVYNLLFLCMNLFDLERIKNQGIIMFISFILIVNDCEMCYIG